MKKRLRGLPRYAGNLMKQASTRPWTVRTAKTNVWLWSGATAIALANVAMNMWLQSGWMYVWLVVNLALVAFDGAMLRWSVIGLLWRKEQDALEREESKITEAFYAMIIEEYKSRDRSN